LTSRKGILQKELRRLKTKSLKPNKSREKKTD